MKKIFLVLTVMALTTFFATAQNSMEFSRVLLVESLDSVPQGKIWKVTNILPTLDGTGSSKIQVNGNDIVVAFTNGTYGIFMQYSNTSAYANDYHYNGLQGPYWLPEGTTLQAGTNVQYISVIEFNIQ
jgi:hypothetical protein